MSRKNKKIQKMQEQREKWNRKLKREKALDKKLAEQPDTEIPIRCQDCGEKGWVLPTDKLDKIGVCRRCGGRNFRYI